MAFVSTKAVGSTVLGAEVGLAARVGIRKIEALLYELARRDVVRPSDRGFVILRPGGAGAVAPALTTGSDEHRAEDRDRLRKMMHYAESAKCRWGQVLEYFGEAVGSPCGRCDRCDRCADGELR